MTYSLQVNGSLQTKESSVHKLLSDMLYPSLLGEYENGWELLYKLELASATPLGILARLYMSTQLRDLLISRSTGLADKRARVTMCELQ